MVKIKENLTMDDTTFDADGCIDLMLFEEREHENRIYWMKEKNGRNLVVQDRGDANLVIDILPQDYIVRGCMYHDNKLMLADGSGQNRNYTRLSNRHPFQRMTNKMYGNYRPQNINA